MKNYIIDEEKISTFIKNYKKERDKIIINYADGNKTEILNTIENEKHILNIMKRQVKESERYKKEIEYVVKVCKLVIKIVFIVGTIGSLLISIPFAKNIIDIITVELVALLFSTPIYLGLGITIRDQNIILKDIEKNQFFLENENQFFEYVNEDEKNLPNNLKEETKEVIKYVNRKKENSEIPPLTINDIDKISYNTLVEILELNNNTKKSTKKKRR